MNTHFNDTEWSTYKRLITLSILCFAVLSCDKAASPPESTEPAPLSTDTNAFADLHQAEQHFWETSRAQINSIQNAAQIFSESVNTFLNQPNPKNLTSAQKNISDTKKMLAKLFALKQLQHASPETFRTFNDYLFRIEANPIQPGFIDKIKQYPVSGMVYDIGFKIDKESLLQQNGLTDSEEIVLGIYALEFMLYGEFGERNENDYLPSNKLSSEHKAQGLKSASEIPNNRRRQLLQIQSDLLLSDLQALQTSFSEASGDTIGNWKALSPQLKISYARTALQNGITNILIRLAELQSQLNEESVSELPPTQAQLDQFNLKASLTAKKLETLASLTLYLGEIERNAATTAIASSKSIIDELIWDSSVAPDAYNEKFKMSYELLKNAL